MLSSLLRMESAYVVRRNAGRPVPDFGTTITRGRHCSARMFFLSTAHFYKHCQGLANWEKADVNILKRSAFTLNVMLTKRLSLPSVNDYNTFNTIGICISVASSNKIILNV